MPTTPLPVIRGTSTALYPFTQTYICMTGRSDGQTATPARWVQAPPLVQFTFNYDLLTQANKNTLKAALESAQGEFALNLSADTDQLYSNLSFESDEFIGTETQSRLYSNKWTLTQTVPQNFMPGSSGGAYPTLSTGAIGQLPYSQKVRYQTIVSKMKSGPKYTYAEFASGLSGFPTTGLMGWEFTESGLIDTEVNTKIAHFLANWGDCFPFTFTDEDGTVYSNVYYASSQLVINRTSVNRSSIKTALVQMN